VTQREIGFLLIGLGLGLIVLPQLELERAFFR